MEDDKAVILMIILSPDIVTYSISTFLLLCWFKFVTYIIIVLHFVFVLLLYSFTLIWYMSNVLEYI